jgi:hypothetical protein
MEKETLTKRERILWDWLIKALRSSSDWTEQELEQFVEIKFNQAIQDEK